MSSKYLLPRAQGLVRGTRCVCIHSRTQMGWDRPPKCQMRGTGRRGLGVQRETGVCGPVSPQSLWSRCCHCVTPHSGTVFQWQVSDTCSCVPLQSGADRAECHQHLPGLHRGGPGRPLEDQTHLGGDSSVLVQPVEGASQLPVPAPQHRAGAEYQANPGQVWGNSAEVRASCQR